MRRSQESMLSGPLLPGIISYTVPIILTNLLQLLFNAADLVVVGRFCGSISVGAVGATGAITNMIVNLFIGLSVGVGVTVAQGIGSHDIQGVHHAVHTALPLALISGAVLTCIGVSFAKLFLQMMDTPENVLPLSAIYMRIYFGGITFTMVYNFCAAILRAAGDTKTPLRYLTLAGVINVILNVFFVTVFHMNVAGVALATVISQAISAVLVAMALMRRTDACRLIFSHMRIYKQQLLKIIRIGFPAGIQSSLFAISNVIFQSSVNSFGDLMVTGNSAAGSIEDFLSGVINAFSQTAVNFIGQNVGARKYTRTKKIFLTCLCCVIVVGMLGGYTIYSFGESLLSIYITNSPEAIRYGLLRFAVMGIPFFLAGMLSVANGAMQGMGAATISMLISVLGVCGLRLVWIFTIFQIPQFHTPEVLYISFPISWAVTFAAQAIAFFCVYKKHLRDNQLQAQTD